MKEGIKNVQICKLCRTAGEAKAMEQKFFQKQGKGKWRGWNGAKLGGGWLVWVLGLLYLACLFKLQAYVTLKGFRLVFKFTGIRNRGYKSKVHSTPLPEKAKTAQGEVSGTFLDLFQDSFIYLMSNDKIGA